jgi:hypothetical protein
VFSLRYGHYLDELRLQRVKAILKRFFLFIIRLVRLDSKHSSENMNQMKPEVDSMRDMQIHEGKRMLCDWFRSRAEATDLL